MTGTGKVARMQKDKGFGFIKNDDGTGDLFFHRSAVRGDVFDRLAEGSRVEFEITSSPKGLRAEDVAVVG